MNFSSVQQETIHTYVPHRVYGHMYISIGYACWVRGHGVAPAMSVQDRGWLRESLLFIGFLS